MGVDGTPEHDDGTENHAQSSEGPGHVNPDRPEPDVSADKPRDIRQMGLPYRELLKIIDRENRIVAYANANPHDKQQIVDYFRNWETHGKDRQMKLPGNIRKYAGVIELKRLLFEERDILARIRNGKVILKDGKLVELSEEGEEQSVIQMTEAAPHEFDIARPGIDDVMDFYLTHSRNQREIKAAYVRLGMAELLDRLDWIIDRLDAVPEGLGVASFAQLKTTLLHFYLRNGLIATKKPIAEGKLRCFHVGSGNGIVPERERRDRRTKPFKEQGGYLKDYFVDIGFADRIYYYLRDLLTTFLKDEKKDDPAVIEFINLVCTLLMRKAYYAKRIPKEKNILRRKKIKKAIERKTIDEDLLGLSANPRLIRDIMLNLPAYIPIRRRKKDVADDREYPSENKRPISDGCRQLITKVYGPDTDERQEILAKLYNAGKACLASNRDQLAEIFRDDFFDKEIDLAEHITMWAHRVILGRFEDLAAIFPRDPKTERYPEVFHISYSFKGDAFLEDQPYKELILDLAYRTYQGGFLIDEGIREVYTRQSRWNILEGIQKFLKRLENPDEEAEPKFFKVEIIVDAKGPKALFIQRGIVKDDGSVIFFDENEKQNVIPSGCKCVSLEKFAEDWPEILIRSDMIRRLKEIFIDGTMEPGDDADARKRKLFTGRLAFRDLHGVVDDVLNEEFTTPEWAEMKRRPYKDAKREQYCESVFARIENRSKTIRKKIDAVLMGVMPEKEDMVVVSFPPKHGVPVGVRSVRRTPQCDLPRNDNIPDLKMLEPERIEMREKMRALQRLMGCPPIEVIEFDNCFTNPLTAATLEYLFWPRNISEFVSVTNVKLRREEETELKKFGIKYICGSVNDVYDPHGDLFIERYAVDLLRSIRAGDPVRAIGVCFGHQSLVTAFGRRLIYDESTYRPVRGALQFGPVRVRFDNVPNEPAVVHLSGRTVTVPMTRSGYVLTPRYEFDRNLTPLAYEDVVGGESGDLHLPPVAYSMYNGRVITTQAHADVQLTNPRHRAVLRRHIFRNFENFRGDFCSYDSDAYSGDRRKTDGLSGRHLLPQMDLSSPYQIYRGIDLHGITAAGDKVPWIVNDFGPAFLIPTFKKHAESLIRQLSRC